MSKYKNINSSIIYYVLTITLDFSSIGTHTHLLVFVIYYIIIRLYCLEPIVLGIILMNLTQGMSGLFVLFLVSCRGRKEQEVGTDSKEVK